MSDYIASLGDDQCPLYSEDEWQRRLAAAVEKTLTTRAAKRDERKAMNERRAYGLGQRYAAKTARLEQEDRVANRCHLPTEPQVTATPPVTQTGENDLNRSHQ